MIDLENDEVSRDNIIREGDWILKWNKNVAAPGFEIFVPKSAQLDSGLAPLGGTVLAAFYFLMMNDGDGKFSHAIVAHATELAKQREEHLAKYPGTLN
jgi:hypothetical protein